MVIRQVLALLQLVPLADASAAGDAPLYITPDGTLTRAASTPPMSYRTFSLGTTPFTVPAGVTSLTVEAQAPGGGGAGTTGNITYPATPGTDGGTVELQRAGVALVRANGGKGGRLTPPVGSLAGRGGSNGIGGISYRGGEGAQGSGPGGDGGVATIDSKRGAGGSASTEASSGGGGGGGGGSYVTPNTAAGGGGEYVTATITVTPGEVLSVVVGAAGVGGAGGFVPPTQFNAGRSGGPGFLSLSWAGA